MAEMETTTEKDGAGNFPKAYIRLRTLLDGLEMTSLRYCLKDKDTAERIARAEELERVLMPIITEYQNKMRTNANVDCPDGYFDCGGCCVPYPCVGDN